MAKKKAKGSLVYEIVILILVVILVATLLYPRHIWQQIERNATICRDQMGRIVDAENLFISFYDTHNYDSSLVDVFQYIKNDSIFGADSIKTTMRDSFYVKLILDYFRDYQNMATKLATDSAYNLIDKKSDSLIAMQVDSIIDLMLANIFTCPTDKDTYDITVIDTSAIKSLTVKCPLDSAQLDSINHKFWFGTIGGGEVENHGYIKNGEPSWQAKKRK